MSQGRKDFDEVRLSDAIGNEINEFVLHSTARVRGRFMRDKKTQAWPSGDREDSKKLLESLPPPAPVDAEAFTHRTGEIVAKGDGGQHTLSETSQKKGEVIEVGRLPAGSKKRVGA
jgi:hypothetical protein